jgi:hypothetical protein
MLAIARDDDGMLTRPAAAKTNGQEGAKDFEIERADKAGVELGRRSDVDVGVPDHDGWPLRPQRLSEAEEGTVAKSEVPDEALDRHRSEDGACLETGRRGHRIEALAEEPGRQLLGSGAVIIYDQKHWCGTPHPLRVAQVPVDLFRILKRAFESVAECGWYRGGGGARSLPQPSTKDRDGR